MRFGVLIQKILVLFSFRYNEFLIIKRVHCMFYDYL